jgi:hypothetical protein
MQVYFHFGCGGLGSCFQTVIGSEHGGKGCDQST